MSISPPTWVMAKNLHLGMSSSVSPIRNVTMETISHAMSRSITVSAIMHSTHDRNRAHESPMYPGLYPWPEWDMCVTTIRKTADENVTKIAVSSSTLME